MTVICKMTQCPYSGGNGFCAKPTAVIIDQLGMCSVLWRKGQQRTLYNDYYPREEVKIINAADEDISGVGKEAGADSAIS